MSRVTSLGFAFVVAAVVGATSGPAQSATNQGLVGVGRIDHDQKDRLGETFGSMSGLAVAPGTWRKNSSGTYTATLYAQPDRGYTKSGVTTNYRARRQRLALSFKPDANGSSKQDQLSLSIAETTLLVEADGRSLTGLDPSATTAGLRAGITPRLPQAFNGSLSLDAESLAVMPDGTFFVGDEYGPYIHRFSATGILTGVVRPPEALIPKRNGADSFSSDNPAAGQPAVSPSDPVAGRANNKGLEGLTLSADSRTLYALMQAATRQDTSSGQNRYTRLLAYDISTPSAPVLTGEWVLTLPLFTSAARDVAEAHELVTLDSRRFLVLAHDGNGRGATTTKSGYRAVLLYDTGTATNIAGRSYDSPSFPLAQNGVLANDITPATATVLVNLNDEQQLDKFGLKNSSNDSSDNLAAGWESLALVSALDPAAPDDYFLLVGNDNDFSTGNGTQDGKSYSASPNIDTMVLVYRLTLPGTQSIPAIVTAPASTTAQINQPANLSVTAVGFPTPGYQWTKGGLAIGGATSATLTISSAQPSDAGPYAVVVTNANGSVTSTTATLFVNGTNAPAFTAPPASQTVAVGSTVVFSATATNATTYRWQRDGTEIAGATSRLLVLTSPQIADSGNYTVIASNTSGTATSTAALNVVAVSAADLGRLINLSILTPLVAGETMTMGTVVGGTGTSGTKALLARAAGPSLVQLGVTGFLADPTMTLINTTASPNVTVATNDNWGGTTALGTAFAQVGAFAYSSAASLDAAILQPALASGNYTVQVSGVGPTAGTVIAELYDATSAASVTATTPRLINVSVLKQIATGGSLTVGFYVGGTTARTVLLRAIGPTLANAPFNIATAMADPQLALLNGTQQTIAANNDWGGDTQLSSIGASVGAFAVANLASKDAILLITLPPGPYTAQITPVGAGGYAIVEVYEVP
ncbi:MAG: esterase-like activity of phytase family protein [Verrucomicrobia bacterium]|nr:esterase-like activity of phytase family protein [Verrucomicrobiota bacterium]